MDLDRHRYRLEQQPRVCWHPAFVSVSPPDDNDAIPPDDRNVVYLDLPLI
jgi:hypothetical protein